MNAYGICQVILVQGRQSRTGPQLIPDPLENPVDKQSAVEGVQSGGRLIQRPGPKTQFGKCLEWTRRLEREQECPAPEIRIIGRRSGVVLYRFHPGSA